MWRMTFKKFSSNLYVLSPPESEKTGFAKVFGFGEHDNSR